jgi:DNA-binding NtrC family response regulator
MKLEALRPVEIGRKRNTTMVMTRDNRESPLNLVVTGEAESWMPALGQIVNPQWLSVRRVNSDNELLHVIQAGQADAAVLDEAGGWEQDVLNLLRMIRRLDEQLPVVVLTGHTDRRWLENALRLAAFSVVVKPLELEELLRQIHGIMLRLHRQLRDGPMS